MHSMLDAQGRVRYPQVRVDGASLLTTQTLGERLADAIRNARRRALDECFYCGSTDCLREVGRDLVCVKTSGRALIDEAEETNRFIVRAVLEVVASDSSSPRHSESSLTC